MKKIPKMISTKDLSYIDDMFNWNNIIIKKLEFYIPNIEDEELKSTLERLRDIHEKNCNTLVNMLKGDN